MSYLSMLRNELRSISGQCSMKVTTNLWLSGFRFLLLLLLMFAWWAVLSRSGHSTFSIPTKTDDNKRENDTGGVCFSRIIADYAQSSGLRSLKSSTRSSVLPSSAVKLLLPHSLPEVWETISCKYLLTTMKKGTLACKCQFSEPLAGTTRHPPTTALRRQLGTTVFRNACAIIVTHVVLWLPYNILSLSRFKISCPFISQQIFFRFVSEEFYARLSQNGGNLLEVLILLSSFLNPILYSGGANPNTVHRV